jgi:hypothetical protein
MSHYFQGTEDHPFHISVGAVVLNDKNEVCCHYFGDGSLRTKFTQFSDFYLLMRESMEAGERIEDTLHRGLMEEFRMKGEIITYIGSLQNIYKVRETNIEKTTLYFLVKMHEYDAAADRSHDPEGESQIQWQPLGFLIEKMKEQAIRLDYPTLNEAPILERVKRYVEAHEWSV